MRCNYIALLTIDSIREALPERPERGSIESRANLCHHLLLRRILRSHRQAPENGRRHQSSTVRMGKNRSDRLFTVRSPWVKITFYNTDCSEPGSKPTEYRTDSQRRPGSSLPTADFPRPTTYTRKPTRASEATKQSSKPDTSAPTANFERTRYVPPPPKEYLKNFPGDAERKRKRHEKWLEQGGVVTKPDPSGW